MYVLYIQNTVVGMVVLRSCNLILLGGASSSRRLTPMKAKHIHELVRMRETAF
jgi:hypothetical protein